MINIARLPAQWADVISSQLIFNSLRSCSEMRFCFRAKLVGFNSSSMFGKVMMKTKKLAKLLKWRTRAEGGRKKKVSLAARENLKINDVTLIWTSKSRIDYIFWISCHFYRLACWGWAGFASTSITLEGNRQSLRVYKTNWLAGLLMI